MNELRTLIDKLNVYRDAYYNKNESLVTDAKYDELFDELSKLENETGIIYPDSPTQSVGYVVQSKLNKIKHDHPMLSLGKTKDIKDIIKWRNNKPFVVMLKMDGLTCSLSYDKNGNLVKAETRGDGIIGEDVLENIKHISNVPIKINNNGIPYTIDGEVILTYSEFNRINSALDDDEKYSHPRNLASGSLRQLDTKITSNRNLTFVAWRVIEDKNLISMNESLNKAKSLGFTVVPNKFDTNINDELIDELRNIAKEKDYPIDGLVFSYDDIEYGLALGNTSHHPQHSIAFKFYDDTYETKLRNIEWNTTRTGMIAPVAIFDPINLDGAITTRATLHNISIIKELELGIGDTITVYRANAVIPKVNDNLTRTNTYKIPDICPCCNKPAKIRKDGIAEMLYCTNENCPSKNLAKFVHFVSKPCANIDGLSDATLEKFISNGFIKTYKDIYHLDKYKNEIKNMDGFGERSYDNLINSINKSRNIKLENFINALGITSIGHSSAKEISKTFNGDVNAFKDNVLTFDFTSLNDFGEITNNSIKEWAKNFNEWDIIEEFNFEKMEAMMIENDFVNGKTFVVTGAFKTMKRTELEKLITDRGGKLSGSVSKKTDFLLTNETDGTTKYNKAMELNIPIMSEIEFLNTINY